MGMFDMGGGGSPSAFTSPGLNPQALALLMRMQGMQGGQPGAQGAPSAGVGAPILPGVQQKATGGIPMAPPMPAAGPQDTNMMQMLMGMDPSKLQGIMKMLGMGGMGGGAAPGVLDALNGGLASYNSANPVAGNLGLIGSLFGGGGAATQG